MNIETDPVRHKYCHVCQDEHLACIPPRADPRPGERRQRTLGLASDTVYQLAAVCHVHGALGDSARTAGAGRPLWCVGGLRGGGAARLCQVPRDTEPVLWIEYIAGYLCTGSFSLHSLHGLKLRNSHRVYGLFRLAVPRLAELVCRSWCPAGCR